MSIRSFLRLGLSGSACVAWLAGTLAFAAEPATSTPTPAPTPKAAVETPATAQPTVAPQVESTPNAAVNAPTPVPASRTNAATPKTPTDKKAMLAQIQNDILLFRQEFIARMVRAKEDRHAVFENVQKKLDEMKAMDDTASKEQLLNDFKALQAEIEKYGEQIAALEQSVTAMETAMAERLNAVESGAKSGKLKPRPSVADVPAVEGTPTEGEEKEDSLNLGAGELFRLAHRYFMEKEYDVAIGGFHKFLTDFPDHQLAGAAQFWIAESFLQIEEYDIALQEYARLIKNYPRDEKVADAYYGTGIALSKQGKTAEAKQALQYVIDHFSDTLAANKARTRLKDIP